MYGKVYNNPRYKPPIQTVTSQTHRPNSNPNVKGPSEGQQNFGPGTQTTAVNYGRNGAVNTGWGAPPQQQSQDWTTPPGGNPQSNGIPQGWGEDWYVKNGWQWDQPTETSQYWNGQKGFFNGPQQGETDLYNLSNSLNGPNALDNAWDNLQGDYYRPGESESFYANNGQSLMGNSQIGDYWGDTKSQFQGPGAMESSFGDLYGKATQDGQLMQHAGDVTRDINSARNSQFFFDRSQRNLQGPGYTERMADQYRPEASFSEQMFTGGAGDQGLSALYERMYKKGSERLGNEAAARGGYNSGAALRGTEELSADLAAREIQDRIALAGQADSQKMARFGEGRALMTGADSAMQGRIGLGFQGAGQADTTALGRASATHGLYKDVEDQRQSGIRLAGDLANDTQSAALARLLGGASVADMASGDQIKRFDSTGAAADRAQGRGAERRRDAISGAESTGRLRLDTTRTRGDMSRDAQNLGLERILGGGRLAGDADQTEFQRLTGGQGAATSAQNLREGRLRGNFRDTLDLGSQEANTFLQGMDPARREQFTAGLEEIQGMLASGQLDPATADAKTKDLFATVGLGIQAYNAYRTSKGGK